VKIAVEVESALRATAEALDRSPAAGRTFLRDLEAAAGIPGRAWHRNVLWSPGLEDGYGAETFPTLRAAGGDRDRLRAAAAPILDALARVRERAGKP
jgi:hypothetical protein